MKRKKQLTKKQRKAAEGNPALASQRHIHCIACGRHITPASSSKSPSAPRFLRCRHGTVYPSCTECVARAQVLIAAHDRSGKPVQKADVWH